MLRLFCRSMDCTKRCIGYDDSILFGSCHGITQFSLLVGIYLRYEHGIASA